MLARIVIAALLAAAISGEVFARRIPPQPGFGSLERAVSESGGYWRWANEPESVRSQVLRLTCLRALDDFQIGRLSPRASRGADELGYCTYVNSTTPTPTTVRVMVRRESRTIEDRAQSTITTMPASINVRPVRDASERTLGRCRGILVRFTFPRTEGVFPNGRPWTFEARRETSYYLDVGERTLEITMVAQGAEPLFDDSTVVTRLAEASGMC